MKKTEYGMIRWQGERISYGMVHSNRKSIAIRINKKGEVCICLPYTVSVKVGHDFAEKNRQWIFEKKRIIMMKLAQYRPIVWEHGQMLKWMGKPILLEVVLDQDYKKPFMMVKHESLCVMSSYTEPSVIEKSVKDWYKERALEKISFMAQNWSEKMGVDYGKIKIRSQNTRWGSCSSLGNLSFNWKLMVLPEEIIEYVVVHELAHRKEMNHSSQFWKIVKMYLPDYEERRKRLKTYESEINSQYEN